MDIFDALDFFSSTIYIADPPVPLVVGYEGFVDWAGFKTRTFSLGMSSSIGMKPDLRSKREILFSSCL